MSATFTSIALGLSLGLAVGAVMARGGVCFNRGVRAAAFEGRALVLRIFSVAVALQLVALPILIALDVEVSRIGLFPVAQLVGGLVFGVGMALAGGCIAGILWKTGAGSIATAIAILGFGAGELLIRGPGEGVLGDLDRAVDRPADQTVFALVGASYEPVAVVLGLLGLGLILRRSRDGLGYGLSLGALAALAWVFAGWADYGYGLGFVGTADDVADAVSASDLGSLSFEFFLAAGVIAGAAAAIRGPLRLPDASRTARAAIGGLLMGMGGNAAHGCNIGNGLTGVPLLSLGSILATAAMAAGALVTWRFLLGPHPAVRGGERPEPDW